MDLSKTKIHVIKGMTSGSSAVYLLLKGGKKTLVTPPALKQKNKAIFTLLRDAEVEVNTGIAIVGGVAYPLVKGGYRKEVRGRSTVKPLPKGCTRIFRVHPNRLTEKQREMMAGDGERGKYRAEFIEEGMTGKERRERAREQSAFLYRKWTSEESAKKREQRDERRSRSDYDAPESNGKPRFVGLGAKDVAKLAGLEPGEIRKFLRLKKIGKRGGRYAFTEREAKKVAKAAKKHYARRAA